MNKCEKCGFLHYRTDPCRKPKESTAARKDVRRNWTPTEPSAHGESAERSQLAGTQALPVDTNAAPPMAGGENLKRHTAEFDPQGAASKFDKKAWMREYMREYMRKRRAK